MEKQKDLLKDWETRFEAKYARKATFEDIKRKPKVLEIYEKCKAAEKSNEAQKEVILPTPTKKTSKGLFKTLSTTNVLQKQNILQKRFAECLDQPAKKSKLEETGGNSSSQGNLNLFGIPVKVALSAGPTPGVTIEDPEISLKKTVVENKGFGNSFARSARNPKNPLASNPFSKQDSKSQTSQFQKVVNDLKKSQSKQDHEKSPTSLPQWRASKPKSTPLKRAVEKAMSIGVKPAEKFVLPNQFVNHRTLKRASSFNLPLPANYQEFLTKDEELNFADIIQSSQNSSTVGIMPLLEDAMSVEPLALKEEQISNSSGDFGLQSEHHTNTGTRTSQSLPVVLQIARTMQSANNAESTDTMKAKWTRKSKTAKRFVKPDSDNEFDSQSESFVENESDISEHSGEEAKSIAKGNAVSKPPKVPKLLKKISKVKKAQTTKKDPKPPSSSRSSVAGVSATSGWDSKKVAAKVGGNQNFRAHNLKQKKGGGARASVKARVGKNKFQKTKKLSSYNYEQSDGNYLIAGYGEIEEEGMDSIADIALELSEADISKFIVTDPSGDVSNSLCKISSKFGVGENVFADINAALKFLTGYEGFRQGQEQVIRRILSYDSTLLILPTGGGKSLCFQLPAFILRHISKSRHSMVMVVSPTISLMMDQMACLPAGIRGACLSSADDKVNRQF